MSDTSAAPRRLEPPESNVAKPFWDGTRRQELVLQQCNSCQRHIWFPRVLCPHCGSQDLRWVPASGRGVVYAVSVQYRAGTPQMNDRGPFAVVLVDLDEGVRMMSNVVDCDPEHVTVGQRVEAAWEPLTDGRHLVVFKVSKDA